MSEYSQIFEEVKKSSRKLTGISDQKVNQILEDLVELAVLEIPALLEANQKDLEKKHLSVM